MKSSIKRMENFPIYITFIGAFLSAVGAYWASKDQADESKKNADLYKQIAESAQKNEKKAEEIAQLTKENADKQATNDSLIIKAAENQKQKTEEIANMSFELAQKANAQNQKTEELAQLSLKLNESQEKANELQSKIAELNERITNYVIGGNSYCYLYLHSPSDHDIKLRLVHVGKYPLSALRIHIVRSSDIYKAAEGNPVMMKALRKENNFTYVFAIGPLPATSEIFEIGSIPYDPNIEDSYSIKFIAQNGVWRQGYTVGKDGIKNTGITRWDGSPMPDPYK